MSLKIFGKNPTGKQLEIIQNSPNYKNNSFQNLSDTPMSLQGTSVTKLMWEFFFNKPKNSVPNHRLPFIKTDLTGITNSAPTIIWFGHSSYFIRINNKNILVDPVFSGNASPFSFMVKAFKGANEYAINDFPAIDLLLLTHDHYDHLDYKTLLQLAPKVKNIFCSMGVSSHLEYWGLSHKNITEFDWWDSHSFEDMQFTAAPARHFSGRGFTRAKTLWSSFILKTDTYNLYLGGDSGYDTHFKEIGRKYGPFDIAILECGQYNTRWPYIHMMPEETVQAGIDLDARVVLPVHWGKFDLSLHNWDEPITRFVKRAAELNVKITTPLIGEPVIINNSYPARNWWI